ncbi:PEP-CTERM sorting domain-containing protein [Coraliomargarita sp. W4R53]
MKYIKSLIPTVLLAASITASQAAVTYVDATISNTTLNGAPLVLNTNYTSSSGQGSVNDDQWHLRTSLATNGADAWTINATASATKEDPLSLITTFTLPGPGQYEIFGYFWIGGNGTGDWETEFELGNAAGTATTYTNANATELTTLTGIATHFTSNSVVYDSSGYDMFEASLGVWDTAVDGLTVTVYADNGTGAEALDQRTRYDGVGYSVVPEPATYALLGGLCALTFVALRRRRA